MVSSESCRNDRVLKQTSVQIILSVCLCWVLPTVLRLGVLCRFMDVLCLGDLSYAKWCDMFVSGVCQLSSSFLLVCRELSDQLKVVAHPNIVSYLN